MPLLRGEVQGYDFNRMIIEFTMSNLEKTPSHLHPPFKNVQNFKVPD
jgi:hypothetical protein